MINREKIINKIESLNYKYDPRKSQFAKIGLFDMCDIILSKLGRNIKILEIGTFSGISTFIFASIFKNVITVDPYIQGYDPNDGASSMDLEDVEREFREKTLSNFDNIVKIKSYSVDYSKVIDDNLIDVIYIDGDHTEDSVRWDIINWRSKIKKGGILSGHDYQGKFPGTIKAVNDILGKPDEIFRDTSWMVYL